MKIIELEKLIKNLGTDLYSFAYILIPDDLQATQLMIDSVSAFLIQNKIMIDKWSSNSESDLDYISNDVKKNLYKSMYELSKKRYNQIRLSLKTIEDSSGFFSLDFDDKVAIFLKEKTSFSLDVIEFVLGQTRTEVLAHLYSARLKMVKNIPSHPALAGNDFRNHN